MTAITRAATTALFTAAVIVTLAGCSLLHPELPRDDNGQVLEPSVIGSTELLVGDCFSFVDESSLSEAEVTPCSSDHTHIVIGKGELAKTEIADAGGLQNAVSTSCAENFSDYTDTVADGVRPEQQFIISEHSNEDDVLVTDYACIATDVATPEA